MTSNHHEEFFKAAFGDPAHAAQLFRHSLPEPLRHAIDYDTLAREEGSFLAPEFARGHSDLLFSARMGGAPVLLYLVLEHPDISEEERSFSISDCIMRIGRRYQREGSSLVPPIVPLMIAAGGGPPGSKAPD